MGGLCGGPIVLLLTILAIRKLPLPAWAKTLLEHLRPLAKGVLQHRQWWLAPVIAILLAAAATIVEAAIDPLSGSESISINFGGIVGFVLAATAAVLMAVGNPKRANDEESDSYPRSFLPQALADWWTTAHHKPSYPSLASLAKDFNHTIGRRVGDPTIEKHLPKANAILTAMGKSVIRVQKHHEGPKRQPKVHVEIIDVSQGSSQKIVYQASYKVGDTHALWRRLKKRLRSDSIKSVELQYRDGTSYPVTPITQWFGPGKSGVIFHDEDVIVITVEQRHAAEINSGGGIWPWLQKPVYDSIEAWVGERYGSWWGWLAGKVIAPTLIESGLVVAILLLSYHTLGTFLITWGQMWLMEWPIVLGPPVAEPLYLLLPQPVVSSVLWVLSKLFFWHRPHGRTALSSHLTQITESTGLTWVMMMVVGALLFPTTAVVSHSVHLWIVAEFLVHFISNFFETQPRGSFQESQTEYQETPIPQVTITSNERPENLWAPSSIPEEGITADLKKYKDTIGANLLLAERSLAEGKREDAQEYVSLAEGLLERFHRGGIREQDSAAFHALAQEIEIVKVRIRTWRFHDGIEEGAFIRQRILPELRKWSVKRGLGHLAFTFAEPTFQTAASVAELLLSSEQRAFEAEKLSQAERALYLRHRQHQASFVLKGIQELLQRNPWSILVYNQAGQLVGVVFIALTPFRLASELPRRASGITRVGMHNLGLPKQSLVDFWFTGATNGHAEAAILASFALVRALRRLNNPFWAIEKVFANSNARKFAKLRDRYPKLSIRKYLERVRKGRIHDPIGFHFKHGAKPKPVRINPHSFPPITAGFEEEEILPNAIGGGPAVIVEYPSKVWNASDDSPESSKDDDSSISIGISPSQPPTNDGPGGGVLKWLTSVLHLWLRVGVGLVLGLWLIGLGLVKGLGMAVPLGRRLPSPFRRPGGPIQRVANGLMSGWFPMTGHKHSSETSLRFVGRLADKRWFAVIDAWSSKWLPWRQSRAPPK
ncbi:MAG: hypothetical protein HYU33_00890 [Candidatus Omnitrophica bacterium]|nr:hypothetical protein [Candidatus Omnitrophota bacterium]